jgi:ankyrin repeat protein
MGWPSRLSYREIVATGIARSLVVLATYGDLDAATTMLTAKPSLADDPDALAAAAENGHEAIVRLILRHQPRLAERVAVAARSRDLTEFLFQHGMDPNLAGWLGVTPLHRFARQGDVEKAAIFLDHGTDLDARDEEFCTTPLGYAARAGKRPMVEFLLRRGAKLTVPGALAWSTPMALAAHYGHDEIVGVLKACETTGAPPPF